MKILGIVGSRRKKGNTSILVQETLKPFDMQGFETEIIYLGDYDIRGCSGCEGCKDTCRCVVDDDMQRIYPLIMESAAVVLGSPTYFYNVTSEMKAFIDRCYCFEAFAEDDRSVWMGLNEALGGKYAVVVAVCEQQEAEEMGWTASLMQRSLEALGYRVVGVVKALNLFKAGEAWRDEKAPAEARQAGEKLLKTLQLRERLIKQFGQSNH